MKKILLSSALLLGVISTQSFAENNGPYCGEAHRAAKIGVFTGAGLAAGGVGAPIGMALGSIVHDFECDLNWFEKQKPKINEPKVVKTKEVEVESFSKPEIKKPINVDHLATFNKGSSKPNFIEKDILVNSKIESIQLIGHTSTDGSVRYNQKLSEQRAKSVKKTISKYVDANKISTTGKGKSVNKFPKFYENQRVEAIIKYK